MLSGKKAVIIGLIVFIAGSVGLILAQANRPVKTHKSSTKPGKERKTYLSKRSIELNELQSGGPPKDGIPSINSPKFISVSEASK
jgi:hypothetical protein